MTACSLSASVLCGQILSRIRVFFMGQALMTPLMRHDFWPASHCRPSSFAQVLTMLHQHHKDTSYDSPDEALTSASWGALLDIPTSDGYTALADAAQARDLPAMQALISSGANAGSLCLVKQIHYHPAEDGSKSVQREQVVGCTALDACIANSFLEGACYLLEQTGERCCPHLPEDDKLTTANCLLRALSEVTCKDVQLGWTPWPSIQGRKDSPRVPPCFQLHVWAPEVLQQRPCFSGWQFNFILTMQRCAFTRKFRDLSSCLVYYAIAWHIFCAISAASLR